MNKRTVIANLNKIANELDNSGMFKEANEITNVMKRIAQEYAGQENAYQMATPVDYSNPQLDDQIQTNRANNIGDTANKMQAQNTMPSPEADAEAKENEIYKDAIYEINLYFSKTNQDPEMRDLGEQVYQDTVTQFQNMKRRGRFMNQVQGLRTKYFAAKYNQGPKQ
jgi:hypothetical protein